MFFLKKKNFCFLGALKPLGTYKSNCTALPNIASTVTTFIPSSSSSSSSFSASSSNKLTPSKTRAEFKPVKTVDLAQKKLQVVQSQKDRRASAVAAVRASLNLVA